MRAVQDRIRPSHVAVIGGGVIGLATCNALVRRGLSVTLIEPGRTVGSGASQANGGQLSYHHVSPMADAGIPLKAIGWLLHGDRAVTLRPRLDPAQWRWLAGFLVACRHATNRQNAARLLRLALLSRAVLTEWRQDGLEGFQWRASGKLVLHRDKASFRHARTSLIAPQAQQLLSPSECVALEPALAHLAPSLAGGIFAEADETADCFLFCQALLAHLQQQPGFRLLRSTARLALTGRPARCDVTTEAGPVDADIVVVAAGLASAPLVRQAGLQLTLQALKGHSLTAQPIAGAGALPSLSLTDHDRKTVYARLGDRLRIAGSVEIGATDTTPAPARIAQLRRDAHSIFPGVADFDQAEAWAGFRPATPTGLPILGKTPYRNLLLNVGHGSLGFTLAAGSAKIIADLVCNEPASIPLDGLELRDAA